MGYSQSEIRLLEMKLGIAERQLATIWNAAISEACSTVAKQIQNTGRQTSKAVLEQAYDNIKTLKR